MRCIGDPLDKNHTECKEQLKQFVIALQNPFKNGEEVYTGGEPFGFYKSKPITSNTTNTNASATNAASAANASGGSSKKHISNKYKNKTKRSKKQSKKRGKKQNIK